MVHFYSPNRIIVILLPHLQTPYNSYVRSASILETKPLCWGEFVTLLRKFGWILYLRCIMPGDHQLMRKLLGRRSNVDEESFLINW